MHIVDRQEKTIKIGHSESSHCLPCIQVQDVNVWYGKKQALYDINMDILKNKITAFIGPSGCGKTTLLRCFNRMNDLIQGFCIKGSISVGGESIYNKYKQSDTLALRRKVGMVFQQPNVFPTTIYQNLKLPLKESMQAFREKEAENIILQRLRDVSLYEEVKDRLYHSAMRLSGGQQQRLCIARAMAIDPEIMLFDEPCSALDPVSTMKIEDLLLGLKEKYTIVIVTHNLEQASRIADNVVFFYEGKVIEQGDNTTFFVNPKEKLTQDYLRGKF